jgi:heat shock protein HslJ/sporulation protein YlmC with PRC-barrel domain
MLERYKQSSLLLSLLLTASLWLSACVTQTPPPADEAAAPAAEATATPTEEPQEEKPTATPAPAEIPETTAVSAAMPTVMGMEVVSGPSVLASDVIGFRVRNLEGDRIGEIEDIVVNMLDGAILFVTMSYDGGLFQSEKIFPVPVSAFTWDAEKEQLQLDVAEETLAEAPGYDKGWPDTSQTDFDVEVYEYWVLVFPDLAVVAQAEPGQLAGAIAKVSDMIGLEVINPAGEDIGEITDIIINVELQQLSTAVLSFGGFQLIGQDDYVIPLAAFELDVSGVDKNNPLGTPVLDITANNLANAPKFSPGTTDLSDPNWSAPYQSWWQRMAVASIQPAEPFELVGTSWQLDSFGEAEDDILTIPGTRPTLNFLAQDYAGSGGCNWFRGVYTAQPDGLLRMETPATTRGAVCEPAAIMDQESMYMSSLVNITEYQLIGDKLVGYTIGNQRMLTFSPAEEVPFAGTVWELRYFGSDIQLNPTILETQITAQFEGDQMSGSAGCNTYTATFTREGAELTISDLAVTDKSCAEPEGIMSQEEQFLSDLQSAGRLVQVGSALEISDVNGEPTLLFGGQ